MHRVAYLFLTLSVVATLVALVCFMLALVGDALPGTMGALRWANLTLPFAMAALFTFGVGAALTREVAVRAEFDRAVGLLRRDLDRGLGEAPTPAAALQAVMPAVSRFRSAAQAVGRAAPRTWVDLADLVVWQEDDPVAAHRELVQLRELLPAAPGPAPGR